MDLEGFKIKPTEGMLAVKFLDEDDEEKDASFTSSYPASPPSEGDHVCIAEVIAVGKKVEAKPGQLVVLSSYCRQWALKIGDDGEVLVNQWDIKATLTTKA